MIEVFHKGKVIMTFPSSWRGVTLGQFLSMQTANQESFNSLFVLSCFSSNPELILSLPDPMADVKIINSMDFIRTKPDWETMPLPKEVSIDGIPVDLPGPLSMETLGQRMAIDNIYKDFIAEGKNVNYVSASVELLAVYLYPKITGKPFTDILYAEPLYAKIKSLSVVDALPLAAFFLSNYNNLEPIGPISCVKKGQQTLIISWLDRWFVKWRRLKITNLFTRYQNT